MSSGIVVAALLAVVALYGCDPLPRHALAVPVADAKAVAESQVAMAPKPAPLKPVTKRKGNTDGKVLILEYHKLSGKNTLLDRTPAKFKADLEKLYKQGYRPVTATEWLDDKMPLPPGASPVIISFDDAHESQFRLTKAGEVDPNSFVGIWKAFAQKHPDFPVHGTFFILPPYPFGHKAQYHSKVKMLQAMGCEIASHTWGHSNLAKDSEEKVKSEIARSLDWLEKEFGVTNPTLAFPYGNKPKNMDLLKGFDYQGKHYRLRATFLAAGEPADAITSKKFDVYRIPRVVVCEDEGGSTYWLKIMEKSKRYAPYVQPQTKPEPEAAPKKVATRS
jgi:peptidoglycan/xylan/chitin deacetylase (PgdA/CDA1 family)